MQFYWNLQLLTHYSLFRNLPCSTNNVLMVEVDRISVVLTVFDVAPTIALDILNVFWHFILFIVRCFFLLITFLVVENYELPKGTSHVLSVPLTLECVIILSWSISFFSTLIASLMMFYVILLSEMMIPFSTHHVTNHLLVSTSWDNQWGVFFVLKNIKMQYQK